MVVEYYIQQDDGCIPVITTIVPFFYLLQIQATITTTGSNSTEH